LCVNDSQVCLADLLQHPGHEINHILAVPGWKTSITLKSVLDEKSTGPQAEICRGTWQNVPKVIVVKLDEFDCGGAHTYALTLEMIRLADLKQKNSWSTLYKRCNPEFLGHEWKPTGQED